MRDDHAVRTLTYLVASTLDGFVAGPDGADPTSFWPIGEAYLAHLVAEYPETLPGPARAATGITAPGTRFDTVVEGRRSYEVGLAAGVPDAYPHLRHLVVSTTLAEAAPSVELVRTDPVERVRALKAEPGRGIWLVGGATLAGSLLPEIDELVLKLGPITLGAGIPLFGRDAPAGLRAWRPAGHTVLPDGAAFLRYTPA